MAAVTDKVAEGKILFLIGEGHMQSSTGSHDKEWYRQKCLQIFNGLIPVIGLSGCIGLKKFILLILGIPEITSTPPLLYLGWQFLTSPGGI